MAQRNTYEISSGICTIIDIHKFNDGHIRENSEISVKNIKETFDQLNFVIKPYNDLKDFEIFYVIDKLIKKEENNYYDAFVLYIHTHGEDECILSANRKKIKINDIIKLFTDDNCHPHLIDRPKILIFDCCRPDQYDSDLYDVQWSPPVMAYRHVIVCYSTLLGENFNDFLKNICSLIYNF